MKTWDQFLKDVLPHVPGCPEPAAEHAILRAAQEFFGTARVWRAWLPEITTVADQTEYFLMLEAKTELVRLERATLDTRPLRVWTEETLPCDWKVYPQGADEGVFTPDGRSLFLLPGQLADKALAVEASMKPSNSAVGVEDRFFDRYAAQIATGAVAALKAHADKSYTDLTGAAVWRGTFESLMGTTDLQRARGISSARPRPRVRTF